MSARGTITIECDRKACHAEIVLDAEDAIIDEVRYGLWVDLPRAYGWHTDEAGDIWCPQCIEAKERAAEGPQDDGQSFGHPGDRLRGLE